MSDPQQRNTSQLAIHVSRAMVETGADLKSTATVISEALNRLPVCRSLRRLTTQRSCHLVGGVLRDAVVGTPPCDIDVVVSGRGRALAQALANEYASRTIELGGDRFAAFRVIAGDSQIDIWDRGDNSLDRDLRRRDLTIHSFALDIHTGSIIDPCGGLDDLAHQTLRMTTPDSFAGDPLRVLRLCRFATQLPGFQIDPPTLRRAARSTSDLTQIASERIRFEIESTLKQHRAAIAVGLWIRMGVLPDTLLSRSISTHQRQQLEPDLARAFSALERTAAAMPVTTNMLVAQAALLLRVLEVTLGQDGTETADNLWRLGYLTRGTIRRIYRVLDAPLPPSIAPEQRWYLHSLGDLWAAAVCLAAGSHALETEAESGSDALPNEIASLVVLAAQCADEIFDPPTLVTGTVLQSELGLEPGPELGRILAAIRRQQIEGRILTYQQAVNLASRMVTD